MFIVKRNNAYSYALGHIISFAVKNMCETDCIITLGNPLYGLNYMRFKNKIKVS